MPTCSHIDMIAEVEPSSLDSCPECVARGEAWLHLRVCLICGHTGCCDDSPNRHARAHYHKTGHPIIQSLEPREIWRWCFIDEVMLPTGRPFR